MLFIIYLAYFITLVTAESCYIRCDANIMCVYGCEKGKSYQKNNLLARSCGDQETCYKVMQFYCMQSCDQLNKEMALSCLKGCMLASNKQDGILQN